MECRKQLCEKCKKKEDDYFLVTPFTFQFFTNRAVCTPLSVTAFSR